MPETPQYTVEYRNVKHPRCEFKTGALLIVLPKKGWTPEQVIEKYGEWIKRKQTMINTAVQQTIGTALINDRTDKELRSLIQRFAEDAQEDLHTKINHIYFRKMTTKWASHSQNHNLTINTLLKYLPEKTIRYIVYHEIAHNIERKHNNAFWAIIKRSHPDFKLEEKNLLTLWFLIQNNCSPKRKSLLRLHVNNQEENNQKQIKDHLTDR